MDHLLLHIESLIFSANPSISYDDIKAVLDSIFETEIDDKLLSESIEKIRAKYAEDTAYAFEVVEMSGGFRFLTKGAYHHTIGTYLKQNTHKKLSKSAIETLSIVAYKQPVSKAEIESIRGVNSDYTVQKLLEKELIEISGRSEGPGRPLLYITSQKFIDYFGLKAIEDLPKLKEIEPIENQIGSETIEHIKPIEDHIVNKDQETEPTEKTDQINDIYGNE